VVGVSQTEKLPKATTWCKYVLAARQNDVFNHR
jgi:hypothetical protein